MSLSPAQARVLIVEDSRPVRASVSSLLQAAGFQVDEAEGGQAAVNLLAARSYDVVLTDLKMAGADGFELLEIVKGQALGPEVVILTGRHANDMSAAIRALRLGAHDFLTKPLSAPDQAVLAVQRAAEAKRHREALRRAEARYRELFDNVPVGLYRTTPDGRILDVNLAAVRMLRFPDRQSLLAADARELYADPRDRDRWVSQLERAGIVNHWEVRLLRHDGRRMWAEESARALRDPEGRLHHLEGTLQDITGRKRTQRRLRQSRLQQKAILDNIPDMAWLKDRQGRFIAVNEALAQWLGRPAAEVAGLTHLEVWPPELAERDRTDDQRVLQGAERTRTEEQVVAEGEEPRWIETVKAPVLDKDGRVTGLAGIARDITERRRVEEGLRRTEHQLRQAQKLEALGRLAGGVAHDFNNILSVIIGQASLMLAQSGPRAPQHHRVAQILEAADRAATLTRQMLAFGRCQIIQPRVVSLERVVTELSRMLERMIGEDVELRVRSQPPAGRIRADPGQLEQVLMNLAVNARDAMPRGGRVTIQTRTVDLDEEEARRRPPMRVGRYVLLEVTDDGVGMDAETQSKIFEPFFTTKADGRGTGLGLATVYGIVKQSGGFIWVDSALDSGTTFSIYFPEAGGETVPAPAPAVADTPNGTETILLIEDDELARRVIREGLETFGYTVLPAASAETGLSLLAKAGRRVGLAVIDVVMPGMSGLDLGQRLRAERPDLRVLYVSGYAPQVVAEHGTLDARIPFLQKPFAPSLLARKVRQTLDDPLP